MLRDDHGASATGTLRLLPHVDGYASDSQHDHSDDGADDTANHASPAKQQSIRNIAAAHSRPVYVIPANEEWMIAQLTFQQLLSL